MKKSSFFFPIIAALALTGCSNDDMPGAEPGNATGGEGAYLAVNIVTPVGMSNRAGDPTNYEDGKAALHENDVNSAIFLIFDADGNLKSYQEPALTWTDNSNPVDPAVEKISNAVLILDGAQKWEDSQILALLNYRGEEFWTGTGVTLNTVLGKIADYSVAKFTPEGSATAVNEFLMTNSVYNNVHGTVTAVPIGGKVKTSKDAAESDPVEIYVERVVAKVSTSKIIAAEGADKNFTINSTTTNVDGTSKTLTPAIKGIEIANVAKTSYLVKNIDGLNLSWGWNDPLNFRSYWANIPANLEYSNQSWTAIGSVSPTSEQNFYIQENTTKTQLHKTAVLITAQLEENGKPIDDLIRYASEHYTVSGYLTIIANQLKTKYAVKTVDATSGTTTYSSILPEHLETFQDAAWDIWKVAPRLTTAAKVLTFVEANNHEAVVTADAIDAELKKDHFQAWEWKDGKCYYYVYIDHFGTEEPVAGSDDTPATLQGIVRNHIYKLTLSDLKGLGVPVFDPEREIIPDRPSDDSFYLAARVNILKWRIVSQTVSFE